MVQELQGHVDAAVRQRGEEYFESGRVDLEFGNEREVLASVHGDHAYAVELARVAETIEALCTCPVFAQGPGVCKHVWATLLEAGDAGYLDPPGLPPPTHLLRALASWTDPTPPVPEGATRRVGPETAPRTPAPAPARTNGAAGRSSSPWRRRLALAGMWPEPEAAAAADISGAFFVIEPSALAGNAGFDVEVMERRRNRRGEGRPRRAKLRLAQVRALPEGPTRSALLFLDALTSATTPPTETWRSWREDQLETKAMVPAATVSWLVPLLCAEGRCFLRAERADGRELLGPLRWDDGEPWRFHIELRRGQHDHWDVGASFRRGEQSLPAGEVVLALPAGVLFTASTAARLDHAGASRWLEFFRAEPVLQIPVGEETEFLRGVLNAPSPPLLELPAELQIAEVRVTPRPVLRVRLPAAALAKGAIPADPVFDYDGSLLPAGRASESVLDANRRRRVYREAETERALLARLSELGFQSDRSALPMVAMEIAPALFARAVSALLAEGWRVEAEGKPLRLSGKQKLVVKSGVDWFDLEGGVEFDGQEVPLPELLAAVRRGESFVRLGDGGVGLLPEEWLSQVAPLAGLGVEADRVRLRFQRSQVGLLDALLEGRPEATCDRLFAEVRTRLRAFDGVQEAREPAGFQGELRAYQRQGLGWFRFLDEFGFGGCLADDMGLGKTVQVLALLEERRVLRVAAEQQAADAQVDMTAAAAAAPARFPPSLAVVPKSVVQNWIAEAARFTPLLRVHNQTGPERARTAEELYQYDLIVTTYGTLRRDVPLLAETEFDYLILDEAQAVKNRDSESAKAVRLLRGRHRLALTGTPVENHLGELWSLFEFLNPGMLGSASVFRRHAADLRDLDAAEATLLSRALRPFLLRRTKEQVAHDLPPKVEQTLLCELSGAERRRYDDLREFYRHHLAKQVEERGLGKTKILVLEALLRLRQAACHSGLLDPKMAHGTSAKFELLLGELREVLAEGHKALVFSQFTSLLALLRRRLEAEGIRYAYLDGRTRDRAERVREFQEDSEIPLFLISLKAGGVGLNLTAADYVYLLDPWWNPAVEAQAVDRSHRIGQVRPVFAYRLVAKDTVEERILELQQRKRKLADAILQADPGVLRSLSREDLDLLLS